MSASATSPYAEAPVSSGAKCTKNQRFEIAQLHCARELPSVDLLAKFGWTANPVKAGLWPPPPAADGLDRVCRPAVVCHHEIDGKVWPRGNFKPLVFGYFQAAVDSPQARTIASLASIVAVRGICGNHRVVQNPVIRGTWVLAH
jgi:hypothetical protein